MPPDRQRPDQGSTPLSLTWRGIRKELQEIVNEEHQETQRNVSPSEQEEDERGPMPTSAIKDLFKKWEAVRAMVLEWHPNQADVSWVGDLYNDNAINYLLS
ncbi:uncharacterized protein TNCV_1091111 [Trichonephila clavipes]|uniref:Uncharacterized protein n=1 Tax=Trichonephila clavipes TaxID=2585209 RepID=A0A8X6STD8_TRICX|nr:uncharacterized protein TNCV_1091111 [Trichonephila clavipes]